MPARPDRANALTAALLLAAGAWTPVAFAHQGHVHDGAAPVAVPPPPPPAAAVVPDRVEWLARVVPDPRASRPVVADQPGRLDPAERGFPIPGTRVKAGQVLAWLTPALTVPARQDLDAERTTAQRDARFGKIQVQRFNVDEAELAANDLSRPLPSIQILGDYRSAKAREDDLGRGLNARVALVAPADATILSSRAQAGRVVAAGDVLFELAPERGLAIELRGADRVADPHTLAALVDGKPSALELLSDRFDPAARTRVLLFSPAADIPLAPGAPVRLVLADPRPAIAQAAAHAPTARRVIVTKPVQRLLGIRTQAAGKTSAIAHVTGEVIAQPDHAANVQAPEAGRLDAPPGGWPLAGRPVARNQVLAVLHPQMSAAERARRQAALAQIEQKLVIARINNERLRVQTEGSGVPEGGNVYLDQAALELETLTRLRAFGLEALEGRVELRAATSGVLASVAARPGDVVTAGTTLFAISDPTQVRVAVPTFDARIARDLRGAHLVAADGDVVELVFRGQEVALAPQGAWRLLFDARPSAGESLVPGQVVDVQLESTAALDDPATCGDETDPIWVHVAPEVFETRTGCPQHIAAGERLVVQGGAILDQYR